MPPSSSNTWTLARWSLASRIGSLRAGSVRSELPIEPELQAILVPRNADDREDGTQPQLDARHVEGLGGSRRPGERQRASRSLRKLIPFSSGDIKIAIGDPEANVTSVLQKLVADGKLLVSGKKRGTKYRVA